MLVCKYCPAQAKFSIISVACAWKDKRQAEEKQTPQNARDKESTRTFSPLAECKRRAMKYYRIELSQLFSLC
eukprot:EST43741.1 Hypothetical protein SS50377_16473 [Spironucleus salmonicida]